MNLTGEQVVHSTFGAGEVQSMENGRITVAFAEAIGQKTFQYPVVFERFLKMCTPSVQSRVDRDLHELTTKINAERTEKERLYNEEQERLRAEKLAAKKLAAKKPSAKKPAVKKTTAKKAAKELDSSIDDPVDEDD
ncbi:MAG: hypothetical protein RR092_04735 [Oscillospiraceae bacterium]